MGRININQFILIRWMRACTELPENMIINIGRLVEGALGLESLLGFYTYTMMWILTCSTRKINKRKSRLLQNKIVAIVR